MIPYITDLQSTLYYYDIVEVYDTRMMLSLSFCGFFFQVFTDILRPCQFNFLFNGPDRPYFLLIPKK